MIDEGLLALERRLEAESDHALARQYAPVIQFDANEPFFPSAAGYTIFRRSGASPSFPREIQLGGAVDCVIEYAIWWDWDIQHLYELEHAWVYLAQGKVVEVEASWHGNYSRMRAAGEQLFLRDGRPVLYSEPGKHAFAPTPAWLLERKTITCASCGSQAGKMGVHVTPLFEGIIRQRKPLQNRLVHTWLERRRFEPAYDFSKTFDLRDVVFVPWINLFDWIPKRVAQWTERLEATIPRRERRVLRIAHRGASAYARENSREALSKAAELGADLVEIDIRISADEVPIVTHDSSLKRLYGIDGHVNDFSFDELRRLTAAQGEIIAFDEALVMCKALRLGMYLDIKALSLPAARSLFAAVDAQRYVKHVIFASFRPDYLAEIKAARPDAQTAILFNAVEIDPVMLAQSIGADYVHPCWENRAAQPHRLLSPEWIAAVRQAELGIVCWHEERPEEIAALKALGVDAICSDKPELLREVGARAS